jgi:hypothetical protein
MEPSMNNFKMSLNGLRLGSEEKMWNDREGVEQIDLKRIGGWREGRNTSDGE